MAVSGDRLFDSLCTLEAGNYERARGAHGTPSDGQIEMWVAADSRKDWHTIVAGDIPALDASKITTGTLAIARGGTNIGSYAKGDTLYASATNVLSKLAGATGHDGYLFTWNDTTGIPEWRADAGGGGGSSTLAGDSDVSISSPADRNLLIYHSSDSKWHNDTLVAGDIPALDASKITTGQLALARGGTGVDLSASGGATFVLAQDGSHVISARALIAADLPSLDASKITTGTLAIARGGTNLGSYVLGDTLYASATNVLSALAGNTTSTKKFLRQTGTGSVSAAPAWDTLVAGDIPSLAASIITSGTLALARGGTNADLSASGGTTAVLAQDASHVISARNLVAADIPALDASKITTGTLAVAQGGTNISSYTTGDVLYASSSSVLSKLGIGTSGQILVVSGGAPTWSTPSAGSAGSFTQYDPDLPPGSPSSSDDEFNGTSLSGSWTQVNWQSGGANMTYDQDTTRPGGLFVLGKASGGGTVRCLLKALPAGDFTIQVMVMLGKVASSFANTGIILSTTNTNATGTQYFGYLVCDTSGWERYAQTGTNFAGAATTQYGADPWVQHSAIIQMVRTGTSTYVGFSPDGRNFSFTAAALFTSISPSYMGIVIGNSSTSALQCSFLHFRYSATAFALFGGNRTILGG